MMERVCFSLKREPTPYLPETASLSHEANRLSEKLKHYVPWLQPANGVLFVARSDIHRQA